MSSNKLNLSLEGRRNKSRAVVARSGSDDVSEEEIKLVGVSTSLVSTILSAPSKIPSKNLSEISRRQKDHRVGKSTQAPKKSDNRSSSENSSDVVANQENMENNPKDRKRKSRDSDSESPSKRQRIASSASNQKIDMPRFVASKILELLPADQAQPVQARPPLVELLPRSPDKKPEAITTGASDFTKELEKNMERLAATKAAWAFMVQSAGLKTFITPPDSDDSQSDDSAYSPSTDARKPVKNLRGDTNGSSEANHNLKPSHADEKEDLRQTGGASETQMIHKTEQPAEVAGAARTNPVIPPSLSLMPSATSRGWLSNLCELAAGKALVLRRLNTTPEDEVIQSLSLENFAGPGHELSMYGYEGPMRRYGLPEGNEGFIQATSTIKRV